MRPCTGTQRISGWVTVVAPRLVILVCDVGHVIDEYARLRAATGFAVAHVNQHHAWLLGYHSFLPLCLSST